MLKTKKLLTATLAAIIGLSFVSCIQNTNQTPAPTPNQGNEQEQEQEQQQEQEQEEEDPDAGIDFTDYSTNYAICVKNNSTKSMVLFKGEPSQKQIIGGVRASSTSHIKKDATFFSTTSDFVVYVVTLDDYKEYKDNLSKLNSSPYTTFYAVYNTITTNENVYQISGALAGKYKIVVNNPSKYNVELRNMGPEGDTIGFSLSQTFEKAFHAEKGEYMIYPVFRKFDKTTSEILSTYPTYVTGQLAGQAKSWEFSLDDETEEVQFNTNKWLGGVRFTPSAAYIKIINAADQGLQFFISETSTPYVTAAGGKRINTGKELVFPIMMAKTSSSSYETEKVVAGYRCGTNRIDDIYLNGDSSTTETYKAGYMYTYTISGNPETGYVVTPLMEEVGNKTTVIKEDAWTETVKDENGADKLVEHPAVTEEVEVTTKVLKATAVDWSTF